MDQKTLATIFIMATVALTLNANAVSWSSSVDTNSTHWSIYRQTSNINFDLSGTIDGNVSPVDFHGRVLGAYQAYYSEVGSNDVRLRDRTSALQGRYKSEDAINMQSNADNDIDILVIKPVGTDVYTIDYYEQWPVSLTSSRNIAYSGQQINDREFEGNNGDFVGSNFLYNHELSKESRLVMGLQRMNATVLSINDSILQSEFEPTKYLGYLITANTAGISDLWYRFSSPHYDVKHQNYPSLSEGDERYYGTFGLARKIEMRSTFENYDTSEYDWLPCCCTDNWVNMGMQDQQVYNNADGVFSSS